MRALLDKAAFLRHPAFRKFGLPLIGFLVLLLAVFVVLAWGKDLDARHRRLDFTETFVFDTGTFADYLAWSERRLRAAHPDATDEVIANLAPFRLEPAATCASSASAAYRNGVVLTHDLLDSPYMMRALGAYFRERCFLVYGLQLPGHGTQPGDLLQTRWQDWAAAERFAARTLAMEVDNVYLSGHGVGGTLAILEAAGNAGVDGLMLFAPALDARPNSWRATAGRLLGWLVPAARWAEVVPTYSAYRYDSTTYDLTNEANALVDAVGDALPNRPFEVPVLTVLSLEDASISAQAVLDYMSERVHPLSDLLVYSGQELTVMDGQSTVTSSDPELKLLSLSHRGLMIPQEDPEFGWRGTSRDCGHYYGQDAEAYGLCMAGESTVKGEVLPEQLVQGVLERVESNPFFYAMTRVLDAFISPVAPVRVQQTL